MDFPKKCRHPPKVGGRYWLRRRKPAADRGVDLTTLLGLPEDYSDLFDRIESQRDAWVLATGHVLLHALSSAEGSKNDVQYEGDGLEGRGERDRRYKQLLASCLPPVW